MDNPKIDLSANTVASAPSDRDTLHIALDAPGDLAAGGSIWILATFALYMMSYGFVKYTLLLRKGCYILFGYDSRALHNRYSALEGSKLVSFLAGLSLYFIVAYKFAMPTTTWDEHIVILLEGLGFWALGLLTLASAPAILMVLLVLCARCFSYAFCGFYHWRRARSGVDHGIKHEEQRQESIGDTGSERESVTLLWLESMRKGPRAYPLTVVGSDQSQDLKFPAPVLLRA
ncbi:hypothetical protein B0A48_05837 [Cryoendolithus antarcticus]|uniref:Uncharacterized protein n=1 Tax=Cryoendolithus antarcticus TaxID=1507870 RepID=A0A1V8TC38_9PEZI|nr:hypothetical protein B0A48_05837 [Cryoendolithus antarcticus]